MKHKYITQKNSNDCAATCLFNIIRYYGGNIDFTKLNNMLNTGKEGTSIYDLVRVSNTIGFQSNAYKCELNDLCDLNLPIIAHIKIDNKYNHFVIIHKIIDDEIVIYDPMSGYIKMELEEFEKYWNNIIISFKKTNNLIKEKNTNSLKFISKKNMYKSFIFVVVILSCLLSLLQVLNSFYLSYLYENQNNLKKIFVMFIFINIFTFLLDYLRNHIILKYTKNIDSNITNSTYRKILSLPISYHHNTPVGDVISRINDLSSIKEFINQISFTFIVDIIYILFISIVLFIINKVLFILLLIFTLIYILVYVIYRNQLRNKSLINKENSSISSTLLVESLLSIDTIKNTNIEDNIYEEFHKKYNKFLDSNFVLNKIIIHLNLFQNLISSTSIIILIFIGIILYKNNIISLSYVITFNSLVIYYYISIKNIISLDEIIIEAKNSLQRLNYLYNKPQTQNKSNKNINSINKITFNNLKYSYNGLNNIIKNINFTINKDDYVFIKGKSGVGKSTIFKLLTKQLEVDRKMITINDIDINDINRHDIINNVCYVSQNEYIFTDTVLNNIKMYQNISDKEIDKALKITKLDNILKRRNMNLDSTLEENAHNLSGGERQRIILTRSLLQNKKVLILDETMNEIDLESERNILKKIKKEYNITLILISHRDNNSDLFNKIIKV